ncbi:hypothetical protein AAG570_012668 [Ranatra chinensis]|uniref:Uncharacterized protein n=1 Tax=Ranatra chinensis TaxID=642074 RepID=A0ABD0YGH3_9HEMI
MIKIVPRNESAKDHYDNRTRKWTTTCQHGPKECDGNKIAACAIDELRNNENIINFIYCMSTSMEPEDIVQKQLLDPLCLRVAVEHSKRHGLDLVPPLLGKYIRLENRKNDVLRKALPYEITGEERLRMLEPDGRVLPPYWWQFRCQMDALDFIVLGLPGHHSDYKPLTFAFHQPHLNAPPRRTRQLTYISQFTTDIRFLPGSYNPVADALSQIEELGLPNAVDTITEAQKSEESIKRDYCGNSKSSSGYAYQELNTTLYGTSTGTPRVYLPTALRQSTVTEYRGISHPDARSHQQILVVRNE